MKHALLLLALATSLTAAQELRSIATDQPTEPSVQREWRLPDATLFRPFDRVPSTDIRTHTPITMDLQSGSPEEVKKILEDYFKTTATRYPFSRMGRSGFVLVQAAPSAPVVQAPAPTPAVPKYQLGPDSLPQEGVPTGKLEGPFDFKSQVFTNTIRKYWIFVPAQYDAAKPASVLVFQDGQRATNPKGSLRIPQVMENLIAKKEMPVTIGIFITPGARGDVYAEVSGGNPSNRSFEYDSLGGLYAKFIIDEMLPEVAKTYNLSKDPENRAIGGTSSGAICAFNVAWERPDQFRKVISCIGSFTDIKGGHVFPQRILDSEKNPIRVFIEDTLHDNPSPNNPKRDWHLQNIAMVEALKAKGYDMEYVFEEGNHSDNHGGSIMPQMMKWLWR